MTVVASLAQMAYFDFLQTGEGNGVIEAVAGAGKTWTLIEGLEYMPGKVFLGAYNSKMASELKERVAGRKDVWASTFHSAGYRQLMYSWKNSSIKIDKKKVDGIAMQMTVNRQDLVPILPFISSIVSMAKQRGIGALVSAGDANDNQVWQDMIDHFDLLADFPEDLRMDQVIPFARAVLSKSNASRLVIDFDDMVYMPLVCRLPMLKYDWVLIDEAQDTNPTRRALAAAMMTAKGRLIAVGDKHQAIFGFTGADNDSLDTISEQFNATKLALTVSYRCPKAVVEVARRYVSHIESAPNAPAGEFATMDLKDALSMVEPGDAMICRFNKYLVQSCFALIRAGVAAKIEGRVVGNGLMHLAQRWKVSDLYKLGERLEAYRTRKVAIATEAKQDTKVDQINDLVDTLEVIIARALSLNPQANLTDLCDLIKSIFGDEVSAKDTVTLCSVHRSKGLEWNRVFVLGLSELTPRVSQAWMEEQELNLCYVACTRAKNTLIEVTGVKEDRERRR